MKKKETATTISDYRPISCCNTVYKIISKILAGRLKKCLPEAISPNQSAFIEERLLLENVLLATELVKDYHKDHGRPRCALKLDISKAFDTVEWSFIIEVLRSMELPELFVRWVEICLSTASFSISVNGEAAGYFNSGRGIRQGCALSPYLYVIVSNVLSSMLDQGALSGKFGLHPKCRDVLITHISFADDIMVFTDGASSSLEGVMSILHDFAKISGLRVNNSKSEIFVAGATNEDIIDRASAIGLTVGTLPVRYLGLPLTTRSLQSNDYAPLVDRIRQRYLGWSTKLLSFAGRLVLIRSVIASTVNFWSSAFCLPNKCLLEIERMSNAFLWSGSPNQHHKTKVAWDDVCRPKVEGDLGIRKLQDSSRVFALNLIWKLVTSSTSLWVSWVRRFLIRQHSFWDVPSTSLGSWIWRKLLKLRPLASEFFKVEVRNGVSVSFWYDNWLPNGPLIQQTGMAGPRSLGIPLQATVAEVANEDGWRIRSRARHHAAVIQRIFSHPTPSVDGGADVVLWRHDDLLVKPSFSSARTWEQVRQKHNKLDWTKLVWFHQDIPRCSFITWLAFRDRLSTGDKMRAWGQEQHCVFCGERNETRDHLFFACPYSYTLWIDVSGPLWGRHLNPGWNETIRYLLDGKFEADLFILQRLALQVTVSTLWKERNDRRHGQSHKAVHQLFRSIDKVIRARLHAFSYPTSPKLRNIMQKWVSGR